jgi:hypothetical protein
MARLFTAVGDLRASMGPPIMVMDRAWFAAAGHQRHGSQHRHGGLADADHMAVAIDALQVADELLHVVDVVVQVETRPRTAAPGGRFFQSVM